MARGDASGQYVPEALSGNPPSVEVLSTYIQRELSRISQSINSAYAQHVEKVSVVPAKPREGNLRYADGTNWDPGSGAGFYSYHDGAWRYLEYSNIQAAALLLPYIGKAIWGFTYANSAGDATNDIDIAAGGALDSTLSYLIQGAALTKQLDAAWAVGNNAGGLDTGSIGNSDYYIWAIARSDTGVVDYLFSLSSTAPTMPTNYNYKRLIGWFKRVGGTIVAFKTYEIEGGGIEFLWVSPTLDLDAPAGLTTSRRLDTVKVPVNFSVLALLTVTVQDSFNAQAFVHCPDHADQAIAANQAPLFNTSSQGSSLAGYQMEVRTSSSGQVAARADLATMDNYRISTVGFRWARRN